MQHGSLVVGCVSVRVMAISLSTLFLGLRYHLHRHHHRSVPWLSVKDINGSRLRKVKNCPSRAAAADDTLPSTWDVMLHCCGWSLIENTICTAIHQARGTVWVLLLPYHSVNEYLWTMGGGGCGGGLAPSLCIPRARGCSSCRWSEPASHSFSRYWTVQHRATHRLRRCWGCPA